jgi:hypothetical protein
MPGVAEEGPGAPDPGPRWSVPCQGGRDKAEPQKVKQVFRHSTSLIRVRPLDVLVAGRNMRVQ